VHPPTGNEVILTDEVCIGEDDNSGGGSETGLDASQTYDLTALLQAFEPHPQQGWHVKLTVNNEGSQGADVKHKVFWVGPCAPPPTTPTTSPSTTSTSTTSTSSTSTTAPEATTTTAGGVSPTTVPGQLPRTGSTTGPMVGIAAALLAGGAALVGFSRRLGHS
jgi:LPXTG-motif cell wall-anchored protein